MLCIGWVQFPHRARILILQTNQPYRNTDKRVTLQKNVYHYYQTNEPNILGGYMTYSTLDEAWKHLGKSFCGGVVNEIKVIVAVNSKWWNGGKYTGCLSEIVSSGTIHKA